MLCDGTKSITTNQMHARIPNTLVKRDCWTNLCIDVNSFVKECFPVTGQGAGSRVSQAVYSTPQNPHTSRQQSQGAVGGGSGDMAALHREQ